MSTGLIQLGSDGKRKLYNGKLLLVSAGDPCCCGEVPVDPNDPDWDPPYPDPDPDRECCGYKVGFTFKDESVFESPCCYSNESACEISFPAIPIQSEWTANYKAIIAEANELREARLPWDINSCGGYSTTTELRSYQEWDEFLQEWVTYYYKLRAFAQITSIKQMHITYLTCNSDGDILSYTHLIALGGDYTAGNCCAFTKDASTNHTVDVGHADRILGGCSMEIQNNFCCTDGISGGNVLCSKSDTDTCWTLEPYCEDEAP